MTMKKLHKRLKNPDANLPLAYQKNQKRLGDSDDEDEANKKPKLTVENAFEDPEEIEQDTKLAKLDPEDEMGHLKPDPIVEENEEDKSESAMKEKKDPKDCRKFDPRMSGPGRAEGLIEGCAAQLAFKNISTIPDMIPEKQPSADNPTFFTEYNLPCCLRRCKFPKEQDVLHELKMNKAKRRTLIAPPLDLGALDPRLSHLAKEAQMEQFLAEVKNYNNHDRLMTSRMDNVLVYKIPDDVWER